MIVALLNLVVVAADGFKIAGEIGIGARVFAAVRLKCRVDDDVGGSAIHSRNEGMGTISS